MSAPSFGSMLVDVGASMGALVVVAPAILFGMEIAMTPLSSDRSPLRSAVLERRVRRRSIYAAVYPAVPVGVYRLDSSGQVVDIVAGCVTTLTLQFDEPAEDD